MNNKFKRALSSILAFVMVLSCVTVMNVSSVLADDTDTTKVTGTVSTTLASSGDTIEFMSTSSSESTYTTTLDDNNGYSISLPQDTYIVSLQSDTYKKVQYYAEVNDTEDNSLTISSTEDVTCNLVASDVITTWNFNTDVNKYKSTTSNYYQVNGTTGTIKGLYINASSGKFNVRYTETTPDVQVNAGTKIYVPLKTTFDAVDVVMRSGSLTDSGVTLIDDVPYRLIENDGSGTVYLTRITVAYATTVTVSGSVTSDEGVTLPSTIKFTDTSTNAIYSTSVTDDAYSIELATNSTYKITSDNLKATASPASIEVGTEDITEKILIL